METLQIPTFWWHRNIHKKLRALIKYFGYNLDILLANDYYLLKNLDIKIY